MDLSRSLRDLTPHQAQVVPHLPRHLTALWLWHIWIDAQNILVDDAAPKFNHIREQSREPAAQLRTGVDRENLNDTQYKLETQIFGKLTQNAFLRICPKATHCRNNCFLLKDRFRQAKPTKRL